MIQEIRERLSCKEAEISHGLQLTPPNICRVFLKFDILSVHNFFFDGLCILYYIDLPEHWSTNQSDRLYGRTQRSNLKNQSAYFGYAAEVSLDFELTDTLNEKKIALSWPRVLFTVISLDSWSR